MQSKTSSIWLMVVISTFFWGSNFNAGHAIAHNVTPLTAAAERFAIALILFWAMRLYTPAESTLKTRDMLILIPLGIGGVFGFNYAFFTALHTTSALNGALIMALSPLLSLILSVMVLNVRIGIQQIVGMVIAFVGVIFVITGGKFNLIHIVPGDALMLLACTLWSMYSVGAKKFANHIPSLQFARWTVSIGAIALIAAAFLLENPQESIRQTSLISHTILIYMGVCGSVLAYIFWLKGVQFLGPEKSGIAFNLVPVFTLLVSLAFGTLPNLIQFIGMGLALTGVVISSGWKIRVNKQAA